MYELTIRFHTDWRIGTGKGLAGDIDECVRRDDLGLPIIPAKTLTGIWRDGCERVSRALDSGQPGAWQQWTTVLFGSQVRDAPQGLAPRAAALGVRTARLTPVLRDPRIATALYGVRPGVRLDPKTHQPLGKQLRMTETVRGGLTLTAEFDIDDRLWTPEQRRTAWTLLALAAEEVRAIGAYRRHGLGRCSLELPRLNDDVQADLAGEQPPVPAAIPEVASKELAASAPSRAAELVTLRLRVQCLDPVLSRSAATEFAIRGLPYLRGSNVLPVVVAAARSVDMDIESLIRDGGLICEPLVPEVEGAPAWPLPRCLLGEKTFDGVGTLTNRFRGTAEMQRPPKDWWSAGTQVVRPRTVLNLHNTIEDSVQRPTANVGGLYGYQSIPAGTRLTGLVHIQVPAAEAELLARTIAGRVRFGTSRKDEYGRAEISAEVVDRTNRSHGDAGSCTVYFRTDTVFVDERLAPVATLQGMIAALGREFGYGLELVDPALHATTFGRCDGWQTRWMRPRPTLVTVAAGSVVGLRRCDGALIPGTDLQRMEADGVGERRTEGFGRVEINPEILQTDAVRVTKPVATDADTPSSTDDPGMDLIAGLRRTLLLREIEVAAAALPREVQAGLNDVPPSQRANVRKVLRAAVLDTDPRLVVERFQTDLKAAKIRGSRWTESAVTSLASLAESGAVWKLLEIDPTEYGNQATELEGWAVSRLFAHLNAGGARVGTGGRREY